jgi:hypothetical protein
MYSVATLLSTYMNLLKRPVNQDGLGLTVILGYPDLGRADPVFPLACLIFEQDGYHNVQGPKTRLGQIPPVGSTVEATLSLFAETEVDLLDLVDRLRNVRERVSTVETQSLVFTVRYAVTKRGSFDVNDPNLRYVTETAVTLSQI